MRSNKKMKKNEGKKKKSKDKRNIDTIHNRQIMNKLNII